MTNKTDLVERCEKIRENLARRERMLQDVIFRQKYSEQEDHSGNRIGIINDELDVKAWGDTYRYEKGFMTKLSELGDPLAKRYLEVFSRDDIRKKVSTWNLTEISRKMMYRQLTEKEYYGYLNGELPVGELYDGTVVYLTHMEGVSQKPQKVITRFESESVEATK